MGHFKSPSFLGTVHFYLILVQAKSPHFLPMPSLSRIWKVKGRDCDKTYKRSDVVRYCTSCVQGFNFDQIVIVELQPIGAEFAYEQVAGDVNPKINSVCIVWERVSKLLLDLTKLQQRSRIEREENE